MTGIRRLLIAALVGGATARLAAAVRRIVQPARACCCGRTCPFRSPATASGTQGPPSSETLEHVILAAEAVPLVASARVPISFVIGSDDPAPDRALLERLAHTNGHVSLEAWPDCDHELLLTEPALAVAELRAAMAAAPALPSAR